MSLMRVLILVTIVLRLCSAITATQTSFAVLWVYPGPVSEFGFSFLLDRARNELDNHMATRNVSVESGFTEIRNTTLCTKTILEWLQGGLKGLPIDMVIFGGPRFTSCIEEVQSDSRWDKVVFFGIASGEPSERVAVSSFDYHQAAFIHGYLCASASRSQVIGILVDSPIFSGKLISSFSLGARRFSPQIKVVVGAINYIGGKVAAKKATIKLISDKKADCISHQTFGLTVYHPMPNHPHYSTGFSIDARIFMNDPNVLSSVSIDLFKVTLPAYDMLTTNTWVPSYHRKWDLIDGGVRLASPSPIVPVEVVANLRNLQEAIKNNSDRIYCTPHWNDTDPRNMELVSPGVWCLKKVVVDSMVGFPSNLATLSVEYVNYMDPIVIKYVVPSSSTGKAMYAYAAITSAVFIASMIHMSIYRGHPTYVAASCNVLIVLQFSILLVSSSYFLRAIKPTKINCIARTWMVGFGWSICTACLTARLWRVWRVQTSSSLRGGNVQISKFLPIFIFIFVGFDLIGLLVFTVADPSLPKLAPTPTLAYDEMQLFCGPTRYGFQFWVIWTSLTLFPVMIMTFLGRKANAVYTDIMVTIAIIFIIIVCIIMLVVTMYVVPSDNRARVIMDSVTMLMCTCIWAGLILPKIITTHKAIPHSQDSLHALTSYPEATFTSDVTPSLRSYGPAEEEDGL